MGLGDWIGNWSPGIGDPSVVGWVTVAAYFAAAWLCWRARRAAGGDEAPARGVRTAWTLIVAGIVALGINKQLDLQSALTEFGRSLAREGGWYERRHVVQRAFVAVVGLAAIASCAFLAWLSRAEWRRMLLALAGWTELCVFVGVRAASIHSVDRLLGSSWAGVTANGVMELAGIGLVALGAIAYTASAP